MWEKTFGTEKAKVVCRREVAECFKTLGVEEQESILKILFSETAWGELIHSSPGVVFFVINKVFLTKGLPDRYRRTGYIVKIFTSLGRAKAYERKLFIEQFRWHSAVVAKECGWSPDEVTYRSYEAETQFLQSPFFIPEWLRWKFKVSYPAPGDPPFDPVKERLDFYRNF